MSGRRQQNRMDVYQYLKDAIQYFDLMPGAVIRETELAEQLDVSRTPIREALIRLSNEYLVNIYPQRGTYVARIDFQMAREIAYMRHLLDTEICLDLCRRRQSVQAETEQAIYFMTQAVKKHLPVEYIKNDNAFHRAIFERAGHEQIWDIISNSRAHYNRVLVLDMQRPGILEKSLEEHLNIMRCIEDGDETALTRILDVHHDHKNDQTWEILIREQFPQYFVET